MMDQKNFFQNFDMMKFKLPLPCSYSMARIQTRQGCDMTVNVQMTYKDGDVKPSALTYLVKDGQHMTSGVVNKRGVGVSQV